MEESQRILFGMAAEELIPALVFRFNKEVSDIEDFLREAKMDEYERNPKENGF